MADRTTRPAGNPPAPRQVRAVTRTSFSLPLQLREKIQGLERREPFHLERAERLDHGVRLGRGLEERQLTLRGGRAGAECRTSATLQFVLLERAENLRGTAD